MQISCQSFKEMPLLRHFPLLFIFILCPLVFFLQRYSVVLLVISAIWALNYVRKTWSPHDIQIHLKRQLNPTSKIEKYLNYGLVLVTFGDFFRPYENHTIELQVCSLLLCGFFWWHAIQQYGQHLSKKFYKAVLYGILACCGCILIHQILNSPLVSLAEKAGRNRALIFSNCAMTLSVAVWAGVYKQKLWKITLLSFFLIAIMQFLDCDTAILGIIVGYISYLMGSIESKIFWRGLQVKIGIICLTLPFLFNTFLTDTAIYNTNKIIHSFSYIHRLYIWQYISQKIMEKPLVGFGLGAASKEEIGGKIITREFYEDFKNDKGISPVPIIGKQIPSHPHNAILQWWLETGFIGALWWAALLIFLVEKIRILPINQRKIAFAFFSSNAVIFLFSISFWQSWWWATWLFLLPLLTLSKEEKVAINT